MDFPNLELHYYLKDNSHAMNAIIRNRCEAELLGLFTEITSILGIEVEFESLPYSEGGLRETWRALGQNSVQITVILGIITIILSRVPISDPHKEALDTELTKLQIEEKKLEIKKLRKDLEQETPSRQVSENAATVLTNNPKILVRRSNFYKNISDYMKVKAIGITPLDANRIPLRDEAVIPRSKFGRFVLHTHTLPSLVVDDAVIEIVSPVLKEGNYKWKGLFDETPLNFTMLDSDFRESVLREEVTFQHGTKIECVLNIQRSLDEAGEVIITGYTVPTVIRKFDDRQSIETRKGRIYKKMKNDRENQFNLFEEN